MTHNISDNILSALLTFDMTPINEIVMRELYQYEIDQQRLRTIANIVIKHWCSKNFHNVIFVNTTDTFPDIPLSVFNSVSTLIIDTLIGCKVDEILSTPGISTALTAINIQYTLGNINILIRWVNYQY